MLNPLSTGPHARFLAFRSPDAQRWCAELMAKGCITDVRGDVLRIGFGLYHDEEDVDAFAALAARTSRAPARPEASRWRRSATSSGSALPHTPNRRPRKTFIPMIAQARTSLASFAIVADFALRRCLGEAGGYPVGRCLIVIAEARRIDELGLVDDPIDFLVLDDEAQIGSQCAPLGIKRVGRPLECGRGMVSTWADMSRTSAANTASLLSK